jgi:hypothetical protein
MIEPPDDPGSATSSKDCRICLCAHDDDIHAATLSLHAWFRGYVTRHFADEAAETIDEQCVA